MTQTLILIACILAAAVLVVLYVKYYTFRPGGDIHYISFLFNKPWREFHVVGRKDDSSALEPLVPFFESVRKFKLKFKKVVTKKEAEQKNFRIIFEINEHEVVVERDEPVPGYRENEIHPIIIEFITADSVFMYFILLCTFKPGSAVMMKKTMANWLEYAEKRIISYCLTWAVKTTSNEILEVTSETLDIELGRPQTLFIDEMNEDFKQKYFELSSFTIPYRNYAGTSMDVFNAQENVKKTSLEVQSAKNEKDAKIERGMADIELERESYAVQNNAFEERAKTIKGLMKEENVTLTKIADELGSNKGSTFFFGGDNPFSSGNNLFDFSAMLKFNKQPDNKEKSDKKGGGDGKS